MVKQFNHLLKLDFQTGKMRRILFFLLLTPILTFAQYNVITYAFINTIGKTAPTFHQFLVFDHSEEYYIETYHKTFEDYDQFFQDTSYLAGKYSYLGYYHLFNSNIFMGIGAVNKEEVIYKDQIPIIKWKITNNKRKILGFNCTLANGDFRGRTYQVWFTDEIPFPVGPWKLGGLPGAILQAEDTEGIFKYTAVKVNLNGKMQIFAKIKEDFKTGASISYRTYVEQQEEELKMIMMKQMANLPKSNTFSPASNPRKLMKEKTFEWQIDTSSLRQKSK